jgi:hypothetical protein
MPDKIREKGRRAVEKSKRAVFSKSLCDFSRPLRCKRDLRSSGILRRLVDFFTISTPLCR